jgi:hypothetical protein
MTSGTLRLNKSPDGVVHVFRKREPELGHVRKYKNWIYDALGEKKSRKWLCGVVAFRASKRDSYLLLVFFCSCVYYTALTICLKFQCVFSKNRGDTTNVRESRAFAQGTINDR